MLVITEQPGTVSEQGGHEMEPMKCYECRDKTDERCSYCLLPVCEKHGRLVTPWYTSRQVLVCAPCQARLRDIELEEECFELAEPAMPRGSILSCYSQGQKENRIVLPILFLSLLLLPSLWLC
jgi:hypothetical protein